MMIWLLCNEDTTVYISTVTMQHT